MSVEELEAIEAFAAASTRRREEEIKTIEHQPAEGRPATG